MAAGQSTRTTLLYRLRDNPLDNDALRWFQELYAPVLTLWGRRKGVPDADLEVLTAQFLPDGLPRCVSDCFRAVAPPPASLPPAEQRPRFRSYLRNQFRTAISRWRRERERQWRHTQHQAPDQWEAVVDSVPQPDDDLLRAEEQILLDGLLLRAQREFGAEKWEAFRLRRSQEP
jgi:hypothetical protein